MCKIFAGPKFYNFIESIFLGAKLKKKKTILLLFIPSTFLLFNREGKTKKGNDGLLRFIENNIVLFNLKKEKVLLLLFIESTFL